MLGQFHLARAANEQRQSKLFLEQFDMAADGAFGNMELGRGAGKALMAGGRLEGAQCIERWQAHCR